MIVDRRFVRNESDFDFVVDRTLPVYCCIVVMTSSQLDCFCNHCGTVGEFVNQSNDSFSQGLDYINRHESWHRRNVVLRLNGVD